MRVIFKRALCVRFARAGERAREVHGQNVEATLFALEPDRFSATLHLPILCPVTVVELVWYIQLSPYRENNPMPRPTLARCAMLALAILALGACSSATEPAKVPDL